MHSLRTRTVAIFILATSLTGDTGDVLSLGVGGTSGNGGGLDSLNREDRTYRAPVCDHWLFRNGTMRIPHIRKRPGCYSTEEWRAAVDSAWGTGLPTEKKLQIFDSFWTVIDSAFACFHNLDVNWDSLRIVYRAEVEGGVSRGRFAAIMNRLALALRESHTVIGDWLVNWRTFLEPGIPLQVVGGWGDHGHFGAGLTPLPDSSLLVYKVVPSHPLGLERGDIVLGYDEKPWKTLYQELLKAELPLKGNWGSSKTAFEHSLLVSGGMNWHLFDTIDILKYDSSDTLHLPTSLLADQDMEISCSEQLDIPGVPMPNLVADDKVSWGIVEGTQIGYVYVWSWHGGSGTEFYNAIDSLMNMHTTSGLILDFRLNVGGLMSSSDRGLGLLFNTKDTTVAFASRCNPDDHLAMCPSIGPYYIFGDPASYYDKPIAVLTGPGAVSAGDQTALRMKFHPMVKVFGKSTAGSFSIPAGMSLGDTSFYNQYAEHDAYLVDSPGQYLTHREFPVDEEVWLTPNDVARGYDTVVEAAIDWIMSNTPIAVPEDIPEDIPVTYHLFPNFPNPFNTSTTVRFALPMATDVNIIIYDLLGREVNCLLEVGREAGHYQVVWDGRTNRGEVIPTGVYFLRMTTPAYVRTIKMMLLK